MTRKSIPHPKIRPHRKHILQRIPHLKLLHDRAKPRTTPSATTPNHEEKNGKEGEREKMRKKHTHNT